MNLFKIENASLHLFGPQNVSSGKNSHIILGRVGKFLVKWTIVQYGLRLERHIIRNSSPKETEQFVTMQETRILAVQFQSKKIKNPERSDFLFLWYI